MIRLYVILFKILVVRSVVIQTPNGDISGSTSNGVDIYLGIRYGDISERWSPAQLPLAWTGIINATSFSSICYQLGPYELPQPYPESEHCLFLNIWVPQHVTSSPVRVWFHGGGYTAGAGSDYDSQELARLSGSIVVTINYRLGSFGFFNLPFTSDVNVGWLDQQLALKWIQANIGAFGGDKTNVMLFGQSAGGSSVLAHLLMPASWPLYSKVIMQSVGPFILPDCKESEQRNIELLEKYYPECHSNLTCIRTMNASVFNQRLKNENINWIDFWPCVGGRSQLRAQPLALIRKGEYKKVPILAGITYNEGQSVALSFNQFQIEMNSTRYRQLASQYKIPAEFTSIYDKPGDYFSAFSGLFGDYHISCPSMALFNRLSPSIYVYSFVHATEKWAFTPFHFNATHSTDIPYVFYNQFASTNFTVEEASLSKRLIEYFKIFHLNGSPLWPAYENNQTVLVLDFDIKSQFSLGERLLEYCPRILKYLEKYDCEVYSTSQTCLEIDNCQWIDEKCQAPSPSSASRILYHDYLFVLLILFSGNFLYWS